jgi:hypothetical protein
MDIKSLLDDIMMRAKSYLESGKQPHDAAQGRERQHAGRHNGPGKSKPTKASGESTGKPHQA